MSNLWIRSQDKECLIKASIVYYDSLSIYCKGNDDDLYEVAKYETKERALEVLDEIQKLLANGNYLVADIPTMKDCKEFEKQLNGLIVLPSVLEPHFISEASIVYNMPEN